MKRSEFAEALLELVDTTDEPLTTGQMAEAVGCSPQRAHMWKQQNRGKLVNMGKSDTGAELWVGRNNPLAAEMRGEQRRRKGDTQGGTIEVGTQMVVKRLVLGDGVQVEFETDDGRLVQATLHL